jgi:outer membrane receptor protein involved in Fe transport
MRYVIPLFLVIAHASLGIAGQQPGRLNGVVRDSTGLPIDDVEVALSGPMGVATVRTKADGSYQFDVPAAGRYQLSVRKTGFRELTRGLPLEPGMSLALDVDMQPAYAETIIVTASRVSESLITAPAAVSVLGSKEIETSAADNFADLLRGVPGLNVAQFGARDMEVSTRSSTGILANSTLVMVDGRSFYHRFYGAV